MPGVSDDSLLQGFHDAEKSDWSEGQRLDSFFGTPPDKSSGPAVSTPGPDLSVIKIRGDNIEDTSAAPPPPPAARPARDVSVTLPIPEAAPRAPEPLAGRAPAVPVPSRYAPPAEETSAPSFFQRAGTPPPLLPFDERSGSAGDASVYGTRSRSVSRGPLARRALAGALDFAPVGAAGYGLARAALWVASRGEVHGSLREWAMLVVPAVLMAAVLAVAWQSLFMLLAGRTPGMAAAGLEFPGRPSPVRVVLRALALAVEVIPAGVGLLLGYRGAGFWLHDRITGARPERRRK